MCHRAVEARDPRFDGVFYVAISTTGIYCRPTCPSRTANPEHRRFFTSAAAAESDGFRPCLRCRPELAPGRALVDAVSRLAASAAERIADGALNGRSVSSLASELDVSERHLRRALKRELGLSPTELAQSHRLRLAKRLLADTPLDVSRVAFAAGFQSLRRFNAVIRARYGMTPTEVRTGSRSGVASGTPEASERLELRLAYRPPLPWHQVLACLARDAAPGAEAVEDGRYARTVRLDDGAGVVVAEHAPAERAVRVEVSLSLLPELMPLLARLRRLFDLDAEPSVIDAHLRTAGLASCVEACPGIRVPGAFDGFEVALVTLLRRAAAPGTGDDHVVGRVVRALGDPLETEVAFLERVMPDATRVATAGAETLEKLGVPKHLAGAVAGLARSVSEGSVRLRPTDSVEETRAALLGIPGLDARAATEIVTRTLYWPDAFPDADEALQRAVDAESAAALVQMAEAWRPWRAYASMHLRLAVPSRTRRSISPGRRPDVTLGGREDGNVDFGRSRSTNG